ncbi:Hsp20/alpha crystallin family protein [Pelomicrobium methylotrophicum]|uniref:Hsp20/alpha crystallin family protein n=1 Tax=Pelomicrobium methylotrophicum TaxID=2602750 RepID=UPI00196A13DE|nr:Hsp20/alpha crystallin family protein [Pelomicrobium methylotrophicum]
MTIRDTRDWMWAEACELLERADRLQRRFFQLGCGLARRPTWEPPVDIVEDGPFVTILVALPGVPSEAVEVIIDGPTLIVVGHRPLPVDSRRAVIHRLEIPYGRFERRIELAAGRLELKRQELRDGCLAILLRKLP